MAARQATKDSPFRWVNHLPRDQYPGLRHGTFRSDANKAEVGYCIYLPPGYDGADNKDRRYPVVYWLHGGRPVSETKTVSLTPHFDEAMNNRA